MALRYAVLEHHWNGVHWDFLLENDTALITYQLACAPDTQPMIDAQRTSDHRLLYLDYEGKISGGRGYVKRWDAGTFTWVNISETLIRVALQGNRLQGEVNLSLNKDKWIFSFKLAM